MIAHDLVYHGTHLSAALLHYLPIDTLCLSPLLFPKRPYHALVKDDKLQSGTMNNPLNDSIKAKERFYDTINAYQSLPIQLRQIFCALLMGQKQFFGFFQYTNTPPAHDPAHLIREFSRFMICSNADLTKLVQSRPVELTYALALIHANDRDSATPAWVLQGEIPYLLCEGRKVIKLSKASMEQLDSLSRKGYRIQRGEIRFIAAWKGEDDADENAILLPTLYRIK